MYSQEYQPLPDDNKEYIYVNLSEIQIKIVFVLCCKKKMNDVQKSTLTRTPNCNHEANTKDSVCY